MGPNYAKVRYIQQKPSVAGTSSEDYRNHTCFSCINICKVLRKLFECDVARPSSQTSPEGRANGKTRVTAIVAYFT